jgi:hypothetical protein
MKVEQEATGFKPVVITLETKEELNELVAVLGASTECFSLYRQLSDLQK